MKLKDEIKDTLRCRGYTHMNYLRAIEDTGINWLNIPDEDCYLKDDIYNSYNPSWITRDLSRRKWFKNDLLNNLKLLQMVDSIFNRYKTFKIESVKVSLKTKYKSDSYSKENIQSRKYLHFTYLLNTFNQNKNRHI